MGKIHSLNIGGSTYIIEPKTVKINDVRGADRPTSYFAEYSLTPWFNQNSGFDGSNWASGITMKGWTNDYQSWQLASGSTTTLQPVLKFRNGINDTWQPWKKVILEGDTATNATNATNANNIEVDNTSTNSSAYYLTFVNGTDGNRKPYVNSSITVNPAKDTINTNISGNAVTATNSNKIAIHTLEHIISNNICSLNANYEIPVVLGGCDCTNFMDQENADYFALTTDYHPQNNNSSWLRYNFNDQTLKSTNFEGNLSGNATTATTAGTATNANNAKVTVTSTSANYPLILGPSTTAGGTVSTGNKALYTDSANNLYYNPNNNTLTATKFSGNLFGRVLPKTSNTSAIELTYTGVSGIEYHSNISRYTSGSNYYAGNAFGFPAASNANGILNIETHPYSGAAYYLHQIGFSSDNRLYHRCFNGTNPKSITSSTANQNSKTWNSIPLSKPSNFGQVRNIEVVTSMPSSTNAYTLYLVLG